MNLRQIMDREKAEAESALPGNKNSSQYWALKVNIFRKMQEERE